MVHMNEVDSMYVDEELAGYAKKCVEDGVCEKQVDLLLLGFGHAVRNRIGPPEKVKRHDLLRAGAVDSEMRAVIEAVAPWYARELGQDPPNDPRKLLDFVCRAGSAGLKTLKDAWANKTKSQIELAILRMVSDKANAPRPTEDASRQHGAI